MTTALQSLPSDSEGNRLAGFSGRAIHEQLEKMLAGPIFASSPILKRFLEFIVNECLLGNSNRLKEYTIATGVLNKPTSFNPQENGIVRIHAGRLRRALNHYYKEEGMLDDIRISIPKGTYIPVFGANEATQDNHLHKIDPYRKSIVIGILPFLHSHTPGQECVCGDSLEMQLSTALMELENFSVISYYAMKKLSSENIDFRRLAAEFAIQYVITGDVQSIKNHSRIFIQLVSTRNRQQVWSEKYQIKLSSKKNLFDAEDEISRLVVSQMGELIF
jgi:TolB-like protein